jgi:hypothetical protein
MRVPVTISQLAIAPVKGMRLHGTSEIRLGQHGVIGDRGFLVIGEDGTLLLTGRADPSLVPTGTRPVTIPERGAPKVGSSRTIGGKAAFRVSTIVRAQTAGAAAVVLGVVTLGLGAASVLLDSVTHQPGTDGPAADAFIGAVGGCPRPRWGRCSPLAGRAIRSDGCC